VKFHEGPQGAQIPSVDAAGSLYLHRHFAIPQNKVNLQSGFCPPELSVNHVQDSHGTPAQIVLGNLHDSWSEASIISKDLASVKLSRKADIAIVGAGGRGYDG